MLLFIRPEREEKWGEKFEDIKIITTRRTWTFGRVRNLNFNDYEFVCAPSSADREELPCCRQTREAHNTCGLEKLKLVSARCCWPWRRCEISNQDKQIHTSSVEFEFSWKRKRNQKPRKTFQPRSATDEIFSTIKTKTSRFLWAERKMFPVLSFCEQVSR